MAGEDAPRDDEPSLDLRDPRGENDAQTSLVNEIMGIVGGERTLSDDKRAALLRIITDAIDIQAERQQLGHIAGGATSEEAAALVAGDEERRIVELRAQAETMPGEMGGPAPGEQGPAGGLPPDAGAPGGNPPGNE